MNFKSLLGLICTKKNFATFVFFYHIPQIFYLLLSLAWTVFIFAVIFLIFEVCIALIIKTWFPNNVDVVHVVEWTITTIFRVSCSLASVLCQVLYSGFDLVFGNVFKYNCSKGKRSKMSDELVLRSPPPRSSTNHPVRNGYTSMARMAMTNCAYRKPLRGTSL